MVFSDKPRYETCQRCGKKLTANQKKCKNKYCGFLCAKIPRIKSKYECKNCKKIFKPRQRAHTTFCSRGCAFEYKRANKKCFVYFGECSVCGKYFSSRWAKLCCCKECDNLNKRKYGKEYSIKTHRAQSFYCKECDKLVQPEYGFKKRVYCSIECQRRHSGREENRRRRAAKKGVKCVKYDRIDIYKRDGYRCQICGKKLRTGVHWMSKTALTIDHIVPLALGGPDAPENAQTACRTCNSLKGAGTVPGGEQRRLFG